MAMCLPTRLLAAVGAGIVALTLPGCGGAGKTAVGVRGREAHSALATAGKLTAGFKGDDDIDSGDAATSQPAGKGADDDADSYRRAGPYGEAYYDWDDEHILDYGHPAATEDARRMTNAVRRYYATASAARGAAACRQVSRDLARRVLDQYGKSPGLPALHGKTCATVMAALLKDLNEQLRIENAALKTGVARVEGRSGRLLVGFGGGWPNRYVVLRNERGAWKIDELEALALP